jgi:TonB family protein
MKLALALCGGFLVVLSGCTILPKPTYPGAQEANTELAPGSVDMGGPSKAYDVPPRFLSGKSPVYPINRLLNKEGGYAVIRFTIGTDGITKDFEVLETDYPAIATHTIYAMKSWRFSPATKNGVPVEAKAEQRYRFFLKE